MAHLFRSENMRYVSITMTNDSAHDTINELGKFAMFHIVDLNTSGTGDFASKQHLAYKKRLADCLFWERKLQFFREEMIRRHVVVPPEDLQTNEIKAADLMEDIAHFLDPLEKELVLSAGFQRDNQRQVSELIERKHVLNVCQSVHIEQEVDTLKREVGQKGDRRGSYGGVELQERKFDEDKFRSFLCGVINTDSTVQFERMLYRISRGNAFVRFMNIAEPILDPNTGEEVKKSVFYIVFLGEQLKNRVRKMVDLLHATVYPIPEQREDFGRVLTAIQTELDDKRQIDRKTEENIVNLLTRLSWDNGSSPFKDWETALHREKLICDVFMKAHFYLTMIAIEGWCPEAEVPALRNSIKAAVAGTGNPPAAVEIGPTAPIRSPDITPTYFRLNKFTECFQGIVDTYGVPRYKEVNPGLFTITSFPFLFGVMYGDVGHGTLLTIFALSLIIFENKLETLRRRGELGEIPSMAYGGRYVLLLMGMFGIYAGTIYNDCLSIPIKTFDSAFVFTPYNITYPANYNGTVAGYLAPRDDYRVPYGVDYRWAHTTNELAFYNSMKMKMSVILGVTQMVFGIILSLMNHIHFQDMYAAVFEFIPRMCFMLAVFGYMVFLIVFKWCVDWEGDSLHNAPNLIQTMIGMFLNKGGLPEGQTEMFPGQVAFQTVLLLIAFLSVPVLLFGKPCALNRKHKKESLLHGNRKRLKSHENGYESGGEENKDSEISSVDVEYVNEEKSPTSDKGANMVMSDEVAGGHGHGHGPFDFHDELIHNAIHTIEFVLGCVSNTASYLRLWALSLAHAELAQVFWNKMIQEKGINSGSPVFVFLGYAIWFSATFAVLLAMDVLECFLHALRLHWVEFQNKFYYADGVAFVPFTFVKEIQSN